VSEIVIRFDPERMLQTAYAVCAPRIDEGWRYVKGASRGVLAGMHIKLAAVGIGAFSVLLVYSASRALTASPSPLIEQHPPRVVMPPEISHSTPKADRLSLFDGRWDKMPTVAQIRMIPLEKPEPPKPLPLVRPEGKDPDGEPAESEHELRRKAKREESHPRNICERHHMRKVETNGGRSWRCRR
jgi:hypothetical protein